MPRPNLPLVQSWNVPFLGYRFVDERACTQTERDRAAHLWRHWLIDEYESKMDNRRVKLGLCDEDGSRHERHVREYDHAAALRRDRGIEPLTWDEWEQAGKTVDFDHELDPRLPMVRFVVFKGRTEVVGRFPLMNIRIERDQVGGAITATAQGTPGIELPDGTTRAMAWARIYRHVIENDLTFNGGRVLDIVAIRFPQDTDANGFRPRAWNDIGDLFAAMRLGGFQETDHEIEFEAAREFRRASL